MSDQQTRPPEPLINASPPAPLPLVSDKPVHGKRRAWPWIVGGLVLLVLLGGCIAAMWLLGDASGVFDSYTEVDSSAFDGVSGSVGLNRVAWAGNGEYAVIQYHRDYTYPSVAVWDRTSGITRTLDGYKVLFVEPNSAVVWLTPVSDEEADMGTSLDGFGDAIDQKPERLLAWRLDDLSKPTDNTPAKWHAWPGSGDAVAYLEINPLKGAGAAVVLFNNKASHGEGVKAELPQTTGTFVPIGWSPSGEYFAIEELLDEAVVSAALDAGKPVPPRYLIVIDAATGKVSATATLPRLTDTAPLALWEGAADRLFWIDTENAPVDYVGIRSMTATGSSGDAFAEFGWHLPGAFPEAGFASPLGSDSDGPLFAVDGDIWRIGLGGCEHLGRFGPRTGQWNPKEGLLGVTVEYAEYPSGSDAWPQAQITDIHGGARRRIWNGPITNRGD